MRNQTTTHAEADRTAAPKRPRLGLKFGAGPVSERPLPQAGGRR